MDWKDFTSLGINSSFSFDHSEITTEGSID